MSMGSHRICEACGTRERHCHKPLYFAKFPRDPHRCKLWVKAVGKEDLAYLPIEKLSHQRHVCGEHFHKKDFNKKGRLKKTAVPRVKLIAAPLDDDLLVDFPLHIVKRQNMPNPADVTHAVPRDLNTPSTSTSTQASHSVPNPADVTHAVPRDLNTPSTSTSTQASHSETAMLIDDSSQTSKTSLRGGVKRKFEEVDNSDSPTINKYVKMILGAASKCSVKSASKCVRIIDSIQSPILKEMVVNACKNQRRKPSGRRWTNLHKLAMLGIYKRSPKTYRHMAAMMPLPSEKTLQNILKKVPMQPGLSQAALTHLKKQYEDTDAKNTKCCLLFDEMSLKRRLIYNESQDIVEGFEDYGEDFGRSQDMADHALVLMLQGLCAKFKQPLGLYFVKGTIASQRLAHILKKSIAQVADTGYQVVNTVCDQGSTNLGALNLLRDGSGPRDSDNYFIVNGQKVFIIYDVPHVFKSLRTNFMKNGTIVLDSKQAQWTHILEVEEKNRNFLYLSKISPTHVDPKYRAIMKVKYAAQVLSNTVSAVLKLLSQSEKNEDRAAKMMQSALVIQELDRLFDATNGPASPDDVKKGQRENVFQKTNHMNIWAEWIKKLSGVKFLRNGREAKNIKCIDGYITTLKSLRDIWHFLQSIGFKYLNLRQLNQDALENLFGVIRQHSVTNRNPTCAHFLAAMKTAIVTRMTAYHSRGSNCQKDHNAILTDFESVVFGDGGYVGGEEPSTSTTDLEIPIPTESSTSDCIPVLNIPEYVDENDESAAHDLAEVSEQPAVYVSGYMAYRIFKKLDCTTCRNNLSVDQPTSAMYSYIKLREWWNNRKTKLSLTYPSVQLCKTVQTAVSVFETEVCPILHMRYISHLTVTIFMTKCDIQWFSCPSHGSNLINLLFIPLSKLLIRRQCQRINRGIAMEEERIADSNKKAQQMGVAK